MNRREFIEKVAAGMTLLGFNSAVLACDNGAKGIISANHGHRLDVPVDHVDDGRQRTYSIRGTSGHDHKVTLQASHFAELRQGNTVSVRSTTDVGHGHDILVACLT